jgi:hypothetical protein
MENRNNTVVNSPVSRTSTAAPAAPASTLKPSTMTMKEQALAEIEVAWQKIEKYNLEFGKVCCEWRDKFKAKGFRKQGDGVSPILEELGIPASTAYFWMSKYEISIGVKPTKPEKQKPEASPSWTPDKEKRKNRTESIGSEDAIVALARKVIDAGYEALKDSIDPSHLHAAVTLAKQSLEYGDAL